MSPHFHLSPLKRVKILTKSWYRRLMNTHASTTTLHPSVPNIFYKTGADSAGTRSHSIWRMLRASINRLKRTTFVRVHTHQPRVKAFTRYVGRGFVKPPSLCWTCRSLRFGHDQLAATVPQLANRTCYLQTNAPRANVVGISYVRNTIRVYNI